MGCRVGGGDDGGGGGGGGGGGDGDEANVRGVDSFTGLGLGRVICAPTALEGVVHDANVGISGVRTFFSGW